MEGFQQLYGLLHAKAKDRQSFERVIKAIKVCGQSHTCLLVALLVATNFIPRRPFERVYCQNACAAGHNTVMLCIQRT